MRRLGLGLLGFVIAGLLLWGILAWRDRGLEKRLRAEMGIARRDSIITQLGHELSRVDTLYRTQVREYPVYRDRIIAANPNNKPLQELARQCNLLAKSCETRAKASDALIDTLESQVEALRSLKAKSPPRFGVFGEAGYDLVHKEPLVRAGGEMRLFGPLSLVIAGESSFGLESARQRAVVSARFTFR